MLNEEQRHIFDSILRLVDINATGVFAFTGYAGSGKTYLLKKIVDELKKFMEPVNDRGDGDFAVAAPTNKAASVLKSRGVDARTVHNVILRPVYCKSWVTFVEAMKNGSDPISAISDIDDEGAKIFKEYAPKIMKEISKISNPGESDLENVIANIGVNTLLFVETWKARDSGSIELILIDEASMISEDLLDEIMRVAKLAILVGDPAQLGPVEGVMALTSNRFNVRNIGHLGQVMRQAEGNPIILLSRALLGNISFQEFDSLIRDVSEFSPYVRVAENYNPHTLARMPALVWRNTTRVGLNDSFRSVMGFSEHRIHRGEPLVCDRIYFGKAEKSRKEELEWRMKGIVKGVYGIKVSHDLSTNSSIYFPDRKEIIHGIPVVFVIDRIEGKRVMQDRISTNYRGIYMKPASALTVHSSQGSQWPHVYVSATDIQAAYNSGLVDNGFPLWKRLAYTAITRSEKYITWAIGENVAGDGRDLDIEWLEKIEMENHVEEGEMV